MRRWWEYQAERFPLGVNGLLIAVLSLSAAAHLRLLAGREGPPSGVAAAAGFVSALMFFLQLRIADEFKDAEDDRRYRPERPVPRGLVTLRELGVVFAACAVFQLVVAIFFGWVALVALVVVWAYLGLMGREFFIGSWLRARPSVYMVTHAAIVPMILAYVAALEAVRSELEPPAAFGWFLATSWLVAMVFELGRKILAPAEERTGVRTYSSEWGRGEAATAWWGTLLLSTVCASMAAERVGVALVVQPVLVIYTTVALWLSVRVARHDLGVPSRVMQSVSAAWVLLVYGGIGIGPMLWSAWTGAGGQ